MTPNSKERQSLRFPARLLAGIALAVIILISAKLLIRPGLRKDYSLDAFVASKDAGFQQFQKVSSEFASNELALVSITGPDALSPQATRFLNSATDKLRHVPGVQNIVALTEIPQAVRQALGSRLRHHPLVERNLISRDGKTAAIVLQMNGEGEFANMRQQNVRAMRRIVGELRRAHPDVTFHLAGPYITLIDMYEYVEHDLLLFSLAAFLLVSLTLWLVFRQTAPMLYAAGVALAATAATLAAAAYWQLNASLIVQMVVILLVVLNVANAVHLAVRMEEISLQTASSRKPLAGLVLPTLRRMFWPCTAVMLTTAAGFASVTISNLSPVRLFGLLMVVGVLFGLVLSFCCLPLAAGRMRDRSRTRPDSADERGQDHKDPRSLSRLLSRVGVGAAKARLAVCVLFALVAVTGLAGLPRLRFESDFVQNFRPHSTVRQAYGFIEQHLTPLGAIDVVIRRRDGNEIVNAENIARVDALAKSLVLDHPPVRKVNTLADMLTMGAGDLPGSDFLVDMQLRMAGGLLGEAGVRNFLNEDRTALRLNLRAVEGITVWEKLRLFDDIEEQVAAQFKPADYEIVVTGLYPFYAQLVADLIRDQYRSIAITIVVVFVMLAVFLRSLRIAAISMIPNLLPVLLCLGVMGYLRIPINMTTAMMLSVVFGIAVDDTLHYFWRCRDEFARCGDYLEAIGSAHSSVGRACLFTTIVIAGGFWVLLLSRFLPTAYFGGLIGFSMLIALAADLLLVPVLIVWVRPFGRIAAIDDQTKLGRS